MRSGKLTNEEKEGIIRCIHIWLLVFGFVFGFQSTCVLGCALLLLVGDVHSELSFSEGKKRRYNNNIIRYPKNSIASFHTFHKGR